MWKIFTSVLALAALSLSQAGASSVLKENARTHASVTVVSHRVHRPTPQEVGRAAGLKIRQDLALQRRPQLARRHKQPTHTTTARRVSQPVVRTETVAVRKSQPAAPELTAAQRERMAAIARAAAAWRADATENSSTAPETAQSDESPATETASRNDYETAAASEPPAARLAARSGRRAEPEPESMEDSGQDSMQDSGQDSGPAPRLIRTRLLLTTPPLKGSLASLERQNEKLEAEGLERIEDEADLSDRIAHKMLIPVPVSDELTINPDLPAHHRYCRPWTARFLADLARMHAETFHTPLEVSSAVRTVVYQAHLRRINGNAAPAQGDIVSPHLTGATIDIAKDGLSRQEIEWMRQWLLPLEAAGKIDVEEEFQQACFHITVYKTYVPSRPAARTRRAAVGHKAAPAGETAPQPAQTPVAG
jgi:hypothetical protein